MQVRNYIWSLSLALCFVCSCKGEDGEEPVEEKPIKTEEQALCENTCVFSMDGECDDGGPDAESNFCSFATDCEDCGTRIIIEVKK